MRFFWDPVAGRYRDAATGRFVRDQAVRSALDQVIIAQALVMRQHTQMLIDGTIPLAVWTTLMLLAIKTGHLVGAATAVGGWAQMDQEWYGWTGSQIKPQYRYLLRFSVQISSGRQKLDGTALRRAEMYAEAARQANRAAEQRLAAQRGMRAEKNVLGRADHCRGCLTQTKLGWMPIGSLVPCGQRDCLSRCHCTLEYRLAPAA